MRTRSFPGATGKTFPKDGWYLPLVIGADVRKVTMIRLICPNACFLLIQFRTGWATPDGWTFQIFRGGGGNFVKHNDIWWNFPRQKSYSSINSVYLAIIKWICIEISNHRPFTTLINHLYLYLILDDVMVNAHTGVFRFEFNQWWWAHQVQSTSPWSHLQAVTTRRPPHHFYPSRYQKACYSASDFAPSPTSFYCVWFGCENTAQISPMKGNPSVLKKSSWLLLLWVIGWEDIYHKDALICILSLYSY